MELKRLEELYTSEEIDEMRLRLWLKFIKEGASSSLPYIQYYILRAFKSFKGKASIEVKVHSVVNVIRLLFGSEPPDIVEVHIDDIFSHIKPLGYPDVFPILVYGYQHNRTFFLIPSTMSSTYDEYYDKYLWVNIPEKHPFEDIFWNAEDDRYYGSAMVIGFYPPNIYVSYTHPLTGLLYYELGGAEEYDVYEEFSTGDGQVWIFPFSMEILEDIIIDAHLLVSLVENYMYCPLDTFFGLYVYQKKER